MQRNRFKYIEVYYDDHAKIYILDDKGRLQLSNARMSRRDLQQEMKNINDQEQHPEMNETTKEPLHVATFPEEDREHFFQLWRNKMLSEKKDDNDNDNDKQPSTT